MKECEHDHRGGFENIFLEGIRYTLYLEGHWWKGKRWTGSEYCQALDDFLWYEGIGKIRERGTRRKYLFTFTTWKTDVVRFYKKKKDLEFFVLFPDDPDYRQKKMGILESRKSELIDFVCEETIKKIIGSKKIFPPTHFDELSYSMLVEAGFVPDESGQVHLPVSLTSKDP